MWPLIHDIRTSAATATEPSQPLELACGTLPVQLRNLDITHGLFRRQLKEA